MRLIDLEAHFYTRDYVEYLQRRSDPPRQVASGELGRLWFEPSLPDIFIDHSPTLLESLLEVDEARLAAMDAAGIDVQVLSLSAPGVEQFDAPTSAAMAREVNDELATIVARRPDRFVGLATLAPAVPEDAAAELERCVTLLGFRGANVYSHVGDRYLDGDEFRPIFATAAELGVPIFLHPTVPHATMARPYLGCGWALIGPGLGFGAEAAVHAMRLIHSGVFDEHPGLRIILGHLGEGLTFWINRLDIDFERPWLRRNPQLRIDRPPSEYLREHFVFTTSTFLASALVAVLTELGSDRIMFASDHPWLSMADAVEFIEGSPLSDVARHDVCHGTAERLLGL